MTDADKFEVKSLVDPYTSFSNDDCTSHNPQKKASFFSKHTFAVSLVNLAIFAGSLILFLHPLYSEDDGTNHPQRDGSSYSPVPEMPRVDKQIDGELFPGPNPLLGRLEPGAKTDDLWHDIEIQRKFVLSRDQILAMGKDPAKTSKAPNDIFGLGDEAYLGGLDIFHVLHCFDEIRKEAFKDYFFDGENYHMEHFGEHSHPPKRVHSEIFWVHLRHCTDIVTQNLMCNADTTMFNFVWMESQQNPFPDFLVNKKCTDFEALTRWRNENALEMDKIINIKKPEGIVSEVKIDPMYWKLYGNETMRGDNHHHVH